MPATIADQRLAARALAECLSPLAWAAESDLVMDLGLTPAEIESAAAFLERNGVELIATVRGYKACRRTWGRCQRFAGLMMD